jgi:two-component sensor histidine kinase
MEPDLSEAPPIDPQVQHLRHRFRNQIQTMTSLVGLFGRRMPPGACRSAFEDMRARFEAAAFDPSGDSGPIGEAPVQADLAQFGKQILALLDPGFTHRVSIKGRPVLASPRRASALAQILTELLIDLLRNGFGAEPGTAQITIDVAADGGVRLRLAQTAGAPLAPAEQSDLGLQIARSLARTLGGTLERAADPFILSELTAPAEAQDD